jgi:maleate isomerase
MTRARRPARLGVITPSSNTVLEPATVKLLPADGSVTAHFARFRVTLISSDPASQSQFELDAVRAAAGQLADAKVDLILWSGTAASWLGFSWDDELVAAIESDTGIRATTAVRAINDELRAKDVRTIGLVTPYVDSLERDIVSNYAQIGVRTIAAQRLDLTENTAYAEVSESTISKMVRDAATSTAGPPDAIVIMCTNLAGAAVAPALSEEIGLPVLDSVRVATLRGLDLLQNSGR